MRPITETQKKEFYQALLEKNSHFDGVFFVGVKTTGVFCHPTCHARKPKFKNCEFYRTAQEAHLAYSRPCKRCRPLCAPHQVSDLIRTLIHTVETESIGKIVILKYDLLIPPQPGVNLKNALE